MTKVFNILLNVIGGMLLVGSCAAQSKNDTLEVIDDHVFGHPEIHPQFVGGDMAMFCFIDNHVNKEKLAELDVVGTSWAQFTIDTLGRISNTHIIKSIHLDVDRELIRLIELMPNWNPAYVGGRAVEMDYNICLRVPYKEENCH